MNGTAAWGQLIDRTRAPNTINEGIGKSLAQEIGVGRGDINTPNSSRFIIARDPFRAVRRGRQLFQRKFARSQGQGPLVGDGAGFIDTIGAIGAGLADGCAACHGRPRGSAGFGGDVATRPDSRDAPHLFGLGLVEMLGDEITTDLRAIRESAVSTACAGPVGTASTKSLNSKGINYGSITATRTTGPTGTCAITLNVANVKGVDTDLRVRPFFHQGGTISMREFLVGAFQAEMGLQPIDPDLAQAQAGGIVTTPAGMVLNGKTDKIEVAVAQDATTDNDGDGVVNEIPTSLVDFMEFYLLNYFKPGLAGTNASTTSGRSSFVSMGCAGCHIPDLTINKDRRVADLETVYDPARGNPFNRLFATATAKVVTVSDATGHPPQKKPALGSFVVKNIFTDFKRHDLGPNFYERNYNGTTQKLFRTEPLWGVGTSAPYGHDGRSHNLREVIYRHGGEAQTARNKFVNGGGTAQDNVIAFLNTLILFPPDDTPSNLDPINTAAPGYPQAGHGSIKLGVLFNDPTEPE